MEAYVLDWVNLLLRWAHVIVAIAWIGSSFYFVFLDNSLTKPTAPDLVGKGVDGELWAVHGGGFYHPQKYMVAPQSLPPNLHWFYWESYSTWLTGFALFTVLYLYQAGTFLIDRNLMDWSPVAAYGGHWKVGVADAGMPVGACCGMHAGLVHQQHVDVPRGWQSPSQQRPPRHGCRRIVVRTGAVHAHSFPRSL
mgnify:CR=1 FL=1